MTLNSGEWAPALDEVVDGGVGVILSGVERPFPPLFRGGVDSKGQRASTNRDPAPVQQLFQMPWLSKLPVAVRMASILEPGLECAQPRGACRARSSPVGFRSTVGRVYGRAHTLCSRLSRKGFWR
jgi:hypothetical protein